MIYNLSIQLGRLKLTFFFLVILRVRLLNAEKLSLTVIDLIEKLQVNRRNYRCPGTRAEKPLKFNLNQKMDK
jgi:hypothetical protein